MKFIIYLIVFVSFVSCSNKESKNVTIAISSSLDTYDLAKSMDMTSESVFAHVFDSPFTYTSDNIPFPALATEWKLFDDTNLILTIRQGVSFHDGTPMTAEDVAKSLDRLRQIPESKFMYGVMVSVTNQGDEFVIINLSKPVPYFIEYLAHPKAAIFPKKLINGTNTISKPIGTGAFSVVKMDKEKVMLKSHTNYWGGVPEIDNLEFKVFQEISNSVEALKSGEIQGILDLELSQMKTLVNSEDISLHRMESVAVDYLGINCNSLALKDKKLRELIFRSINKREFNKLGMYSGTLIPMESLFGSKISDALMDYYEFYFDEKKVQEIMEEAPLLKGTTLNLIASENKAPLARVIQQQLQKIGLNITLKIIEKDAYLNTLKEGKHELFIHEFSNSSLNPNVSLRAIMHSESIATGYNNTYYSNSKVDRLIDEAITKSSFKERKELHLEAQRIFRQDMAIYFLGSKETAIALSSELEGIQLIQTGYHKFHTLRYKQSEKDTK